MPESDPFPASDDSPLNVGGEDVDRLLDQAQALANDIALMVKSSEKTNLDVEGSPISSRVQDGDAGSSAGQFTNQIAATADQYAGDASAGEIPSSRTAPPPHADDFHSPVIQPTVNQSDSDLTDQAADERKVEIAHGPAPRIDRNAIASQEPGHAEGVDSTDVQPSIHMWRLGPLAVLRRVPRALLVAGSNGVLKALIVLDKPFARWSPAAKGTIGYAAIVTVVMGMASLVLPKMLARNPYEHLRPYVESQPPAAAEAEASKSAEAPPAAKAHDAKAHAEH